MKQTTEKQNLSKHKRIYRVYLADDGKLHEENYPVVYVNEKWVYYARRKGQELSHDPLWSVHDYFPEKILMERFSLNDMNAFALCWNPVSRKRLDELEISFRQKALPRKVELLETELESAKLDIVQAQQRYEACKKEYQNTVEIFEREITRFNKVEGEHYET